MMISSAPSIASATSWVVPAIRELSGEISIPISVDTRKARVAAEALKAGAEMINDISGLTFDPDLVSVVAESGVPVVLMHTLGRPQVMQGNPVYRNLIAEIKEFLAGAIQKAERSGIRPENIIIDPGIGFGKTVEHNLEIINRLADFQDLGKPVMVGHGGYWNRIEFERVPYFDIYDPETYKRFLDEGFRLLLVGGDEWMLSAACRKLVECVTGVRK